MGWQEVIGLVGVVGAALVALWGARFSWRQAKRSQEAADKAVAAAAAHKLQAEQLAGELESQAELVEQEMQQAEDYPWQLSHVGNGRFMLANRTKTPKFDVELSGPEFLQRGDGWNQPEQGGPLRAERFDSSLSFVAPEGGTVTVTWYRNRGESGPPNIWSAELPPRSRWADSEGK